MTREESTQKIVDDLADFKAVTERLAEDMRYSFCEQEPPLTARDRERELDPVLCLNSVKYKTEKIVEHVEAFIEHVKKHTKK